MQRVSGGLYDPPVTFTASERGVRIVGKREGAEVLVVVAYAPSANWWTESGARGFMLSGFESRIRRRVAVSVAVDPAAPAGTLRSTSKAARLDVEEPGPGDRPVSETDFRKIWHGPIDVDEQARSALLALQWRWPHDDFVATVADRTLTFAWLDGIAPIELDPSRIRERISQVVDAAMVLRSRLAARCHTAFV
jgi:hypothetical protein